VPAAGSLPLRGPEGSLARQAADAFHGIEVGVEGGYRGGTDLEGDRREVRIREIEPRMLSIELEGSRDDCSFGDVEAVRLEQ